MAKLVACKTCKKEVAKNAKVCPHCGQKNPTVNYGAGFAVSWGIVLDMLAGNGQA